MKFRLLRATLAVLLQVHAAFCYVIGANRHTNRGNIASRPNSRPKQRPQTAVPVAPTHNQIIIKAAAKATMASSDDLQHVPPVGSLAECFPVWNGNGHRPQSCPTGNASAALRPWLWPYDKPTSGKYHRAFFPDFSHIAKTGGGTLSHLKFADASSFRSGAFNIGPTRFTEQVKDRKFCQDNQTPPGSTSSNIYHRQPLFCVVRHPLARLVSSMTFLNQNEAATKQKKVLSKASFNEHFRRLAELLEEEQRQPRSSVGFFPPDFATTPPVHPRSPQVHDAGNASETRPAFVSILNGFNTPGFTAGHCHLIPQIDYVWNKQGERTCSFVLRFEHLKEEFEALSLLYNQSSLSKDGGSLLDDPRFIKHVQHALSSEHFAVEDLAPDVRDAFLRIYAADLCLLGYSANHSAPVAPLLSGGAVGNWRTFASCARDRDPRVVVRDTVQYGAAHHGGAPGSRVV